MTQYLIEDSTLTDIGDAIREKTGKTNTMTPSAMASAIRGISTDTNSGSSSSDGTTNFISEQIHINTTTQGAFVTLLSNNSFVSENYNNPNLFVLLTPNNLDAVDGSAYSSAYQWTTMFAGNKSMTASENDIWYGMGIYLMLGKSYSYPSTLEIPYSLNDTSNTNYSYLNTTSEGNVRVYICSYDVIASGDYTLSIGLFDG